MSEIHYTENFSSQDYIRLCESVGWPRPNDEQSEKCLRNSDYLVAAIDTASERVVGMARCVGDGCMAETIIDVVVQPEYQCLGIRTQMIQSLISRIKGGIDNSQKVMITLIAAKGRENFYSKFGFTSHPNEDYGCGMYLWHFK